MVSSSSLNAMRDGARTRSAASAVTTVRDRGLARAACDRLAGRCTAAPARRCLLATCSCAPQLCRNVHMLAGACTNAGCSLLACAGACASRMASS